MLRGIYLHASSDVLIFIYTEISLAQTYVYTVAVDASLQCNFPETQPHHLIDIEEIVEEVANTRTRIVLVVVFRIAFTARNCV